MINFAEKTTHKFSNQRISLRNGFPLERRTPLIENGYMKKILLTLLLSSPVFANELTLYVIPSPLGIDWSSPKTLFITAAKNKLSFKPHFMGHMWMELKCGAETELTGMIGDRPDFINQVVFQGRGLGVLFYSFPGRLETKADIEQEREKYFKEGGMNFVRFSLNEGQCKRASQYISEYRKNNVGRHYGLVNRPRHGEGAGCSAFAVSFPDVLSVLDQDMKEGWSDQVNIPLELAGPPVKEETVSVFKLFGAERWATGEEKHEVLRFWNPDKIHSWINAKIAKPMNGYSVTKIQNVSGVVFDKAYLPVPVEPIWQQQIDPANKKKTAEFEKSSRPPKNNLPK
jgi:hypothetical protein